MDFVRPQGAAGPPGRALAITARRSGKAARSPELKVMSLEPSGGSAKKPVDLPLLLPHSCVLLGCVRNNLVCFMVIMYLRA